MNYRTSLVLAVLAVVGGLVWWKGPELPPRLALSEPSPPAAVGETLKVLETDLTPDSLTALKVKRDRTTILELERSGKDSEWALPGGWPTRKKQVEELVNLVGSLRSRFAPEPLTEEPSAAELASYGLASPACTVELSAGKKHYTLEFGSGTADEDNPFFRPIYVRLGDNKEVVRLAPGLLAVLLRPEDYYKQRRLFAAKEEPSAPGSSAKVERLDGTEVVVDEAAKSGIHFRLVRKGNDWELSEPSRDRVDPFRRDSLLEAVADLWAERFIDGEPAKTGLDAPKQRVRVTDARGTRELLIGNVSRTVSPPPPRPIPGQPPPPPPPEEYRFAKLENNKQVFEIRARKLNDLFVSVEGLRDTQLARFEEKDVRKLEVEQGGRGLLFTRAGEKRWKLKASGGKGEEDAKEEKVKELIDKLAFLRAEEHGWEQQVLAASAASLLPGPGAFVVAPVLARAKEREALRAQARKSALATVRVSVKEETKDDQTKSAKARDLVLTIGAHDTKNRQLFVKVDGWDRIEVIEDSLLSLVRRPAFAYQGRLFDFEVADLKEVAIERKDGKLVLAHAKDKWRLTTPARLDADAAKAQQLADTLGKLEPAEYVAAEATPDDFTKYGLGKESLGATVRWKDKSRTLRIGKQREESKPEKQEYYARVDDSPSVFVVGAEVRDALMRDALTYLPLELWHVNPQEVQSLRVEKKGGEPFVLERREGGWRITRPFNTLALADAVKPIVDVLASPHCDHYETYSAADLKKFGLDQPSLRLEIIAKGEKSKHTLLVGVAVKDGSRDRFAKLEDSSAICVLRGDLVREVDRTPLELVDTLLLNVNLDKVDRIQSTKGEATLVLQPKDGIWKVTEAPGAPYAADVPAINSLRGILQNLRAERFAAYDSNPDLKKYGLDKPFAMLTLGVQDGGKKTEHSLELGAEVEGRPGQRYARLDKGPGVAVLTPSQTRALARTHLDYVDHRLLSFEADKATSVQRRKGSESLELAKQDGEWQIVKPEATRADDASVENLVRQLSALRAADIAEFPLKDAKKYGLDTPFAVVTVQLTGTDGKATKHTLTLGNAVPGKKGERYCRADSASAVATLSEPQVQRLAAGALAYRNREVARFSDAEKVLLERGQRKATLAKVGGTWSMTAPLEAKVDHDAVEEFLGKAARLKADEFVADKPSDLKEYGLDRPVVRWHFQQDGKDVLDLLVGKAEPSARRRYAKLGGSGIVFLLDVDMSGRVLTEYRDKTVFSMPLDSAQVETLRVTHGSKTLVLKREGSDWKVEGKPEAKPNAETVNDTVAALTGLKLDHYAVDKGADLKLFGLDPPEVTVEAQMGERKMTLHLGHPEGDSKQRYAHVPEKDRSDVIVLSREDSIRLTRDLAAFMKALPKKPPAPFGGPTSP